MDSRIKKIILLLMILSSSGWTQNAFQFGLWKHTALNGAMQLESLYRSQETILRNDAREKPVTTLFTGSLNLNSHSYVWHPNFLKLNAVLEYNPAVRDQKYIVIPNRSETKTAEEARLSGLFFDDRALSLNLFYNFSHIFVNRELATNVETYLNEAGAGASFRNDILPVTVRYLNSQWDQNETGSGRRFSNDRKNVKVEAGKSFTGEDDHRLSYSNEDYVRTYAGTGKVENIITNARLQNNFSFNNGKQNYWRSLISYHDQQGTFPLNRFQIDENTRISLPANLSASGFYRYARFEQQSHRNRQHNMLGKLEHRLFKSLNSHTYYEYINFKNTVYDESIHQGAAGFRYTKAIPRGRLDLAYEYRIRTDNRDSKPASLQVFDETLTLNDGQIILLANTDVDPASVMVTDETGIVIYQENMDYLLIVRGRFIEIQRLPGGQIADGEMVYVDYISTGNTSYDFKTNSNQFRISMNLFDRLIELYFRFYDQNYHSIRINEQRILKTISQRIAGFRSNYYFLSAGFEIEDYNSNLLPYESKRTYLSMNKNMFRRMNVYLSANYRDYVMLSSNESQNFFDLTGRFKYQLSLNSAIGFDGGYRLQEGRGIDLRLSNWRAEYTTKYRSVYLHVGMEVYRRDFSGEIINYNGGYIRIERKF